MEYEIKGGSFPIVECTLKKGESMITQSGSMCWMDNTITMDTSSNGGIGKVVGRLFTNEKLFQNIYTSEKDGSKISFGTCVPGAIMAIKLTGGESLICQKSAFLASYGNVELSTFFNKKIGVGLFGGEGKKKKKITGDGIVFIEIDGSSLEYELKGFGCINYRDEDYFEVIDEFFINKINMLSGVKGIEKVKKM